MNNVAKEVLIGTIPNENYNKNVNDVATKVSKYINMSQAGHRNYGLGYVFSQALNLAVVIFCIYFTDEFLDGSFKDLGYQWVQAQYSEKTSAKEYLEYIFPRTASCDFKHGGITGGSDSKNHLCVLAPNALSEKIFVILWFWYIMLFLITSLNLILIISMMFPSSSIRKLYLTRAVLTRKVRTITKENDLNERIGNLDFGQFLFLYFLGRNVDYNVYKKILEALRDQKSSTEKIYPNPNCPELSEMANTLPKKRLHATKNNEADSKREIYDVDDRNNIALNQLSKRNLP